MAERVGIVGMGLMGQAFILNLRKSDFAVQGFDIDPARMDDLKNVGGEDEVDDELGARARADGAHVVSSAAETVEDGPAGLEIFPAPPPR